MPELPEVERVREQLTHALVGRRLTGAKLHRPDMLAVFGPGSPAAASALPRRRSHRSLLLDGAVIVSTLRHGKHLALVAEDGRVLEIHLGMSGQVLILAPGHAVPDRLATHIHARWTIEPIGATLLFRDPRRFGGLWSYPGEAELVAHRWSSLGPDALDVSPDHLISELARTKRPLKAVLLDQAILAGVGNIYADEALHLARLHPLSPACRTNPEDVARLAAAIRHILSQAIARGGSTLRDFLDPAGDPGGYQHHHAVYARAGLPCSSCSTPLISRTIAQRTTTWCPACQPPHRAGKLRSKTRCFPPTAHKAVQARSNQSPPESLAPA